MCLRWRNVHIDILREGDDQLQSKPSQNLAAAMQVAAETCRSDHLRQGAAKLSEIQDLIDAAAVQITKASQAMGSDNVRHNNTRGFTTAQAEGHGDHQHLEP